MIHTVMKPVLLLLLLASRLKQDIIKVTGETLELLLPNNRFAFVCAFKIKNKKKSVCRYSSDPKC